MKTNMDNIGIGYTIHKIKQESWGYFQARIPKAWEIIRCMYIVLLFLLNTGHKTIQIKLQVERLS